MTTALIALNAEEAALKRSVENRLRGILATWREQFFILGECLNIILEKRLYRDTYSTFEEYARHEWKLDGSSAYKAANAYRVTKNITNAQAESPQIYWNLMTGLAPSHAMELNRLPENFQVAAWAKAKEISGTGLPTRHELRSITSPLKDDLAKLGTLTETDDVAAIVNEVYRKHAIREIAKQVAKKLTLTMRLINKPELEEAFKECRQLIEDATKRMQSVVTETEPVVPLPTDFSLSIDMDYGSKILQLRRQLNITIKQLAALTGLSRKVIRNCERGAVALIRKKGPEAEKEKQDLTGISNNAAAARERRTDALNKISDALAASAAQIVTSRVG